MHTTYKGHDIYWLNGNKRVAIYRSGILVDWFMASHMALACRHAVQLVNEHIEVAS